VDLEQLSTKKEEKKETKSKRPTKRGLLVQQSELEFAQAGTGSVKITGNPKYGTEPPCFSCYIYSLFIVTVQRLLSSDLISTLKRWALEASTKKLPIFSVAPLLRVSSLENL